jgi:PAS domain S-box-containing protein
MPFNSSQKQQEKSILKVLAALSYQTGELKPYLQDIAQAVSELIELDWSTVTLCQNGLEEVLASSIDMGEAANQVYVLHGTLTGAVVERGCSVVVENAATCMEYGKPPEGYQSYLGVPLRMPNGKVIGTICSFSREPRHFTPEEVQLAEIFAERAATAIDNYQLYQKQQEELAERKRAEELLRQIAENMRQVLWMFSQEGEPIYINPAFEQVWQKSCQDWYTIPDLCWHSIHPEDIERVRVAFAKALEGECREEYRIIRPDGSIRLIQDQIFPVRNEAGQVYRIAGIAEDVTEQRRAQQDMMKAIAALAEVGELAAMIVHEIRNPLTTVLMGLNSFKRMALPETAQERLNLSIEEAERLRNLLNEILLYAKPYALQGIELEINGLISEMMDTVQTMPSAMKRHIKFIPSAIPITVLVDKDKLKQVFINLIDNACEAVLEGEVVTWQVERVNQQVYIRVHNGGDPIPPEVIPKLTKPFYTTKTSGTGLGLAIVKRIVDAHGGELLIESTAATGTTITVKLPAIA